MAGRNVPTRDMSNFSASQISLRRVLSTPAVQDRVFGEDSLGGLSWEDYNNIAGFVGPVIFEQGGRADRIIPLRCQERLPPGICNRRSTPQNPVQRCEGQKRDQGAQPGHRITPLPATVQLRTLDEEIFRVWDEPEQHFRHNQHPICKDCVDRNFARRWRDWARLFTYTGPNIGIPRYFRLCKRHSELLAQHPDASPRVPNRRPHCRCLARAENPRDNGQVVDPGRLVFKCNRCTYEEDWDWENRANKWLAELRHTYKRQGRLKRAYVDFNKPRPALEFDQPKPVERNVVHPDATILAPYPQLGAIFRSTLYQIFFEDLNYQKYSRN
ncbi:MAG: hypothetical protein L6R41_005640 [Letrouitia leprolyta]|nr:MAG: hypothetical protein L6R41_005640 [Letrouitia leprolyta]